MAEERKSGLFDRMTGGSIRDKLTNATKRNLNSLLDVIEEFEDRGGIRQFIDVDGPSARGALIGGHYDGKSLRQYYANLETEYGADLKTVKKNYRRLMRRYHPDRHSGDPEREKLATTISQELTRAYDAITVHLSVRETKR